MPSFQTGREAYDGTSSVRRPGALSLDYLTAWSIGPTALSDTTQGLLHRVWKVRVDNADGKVYLQRAREPIGTEPDGWEPEFELFSFTITEIEEVDLAFDQNGAPVVSAQRQGNQLWLYWFSPLAGGYVFEMLGEGRTPRLLLDDPQSLSDATILLFYVNDAVGLPQWRTQEELYATPHNMPLDRWVDVESGERAAIARSTDLFIEEVAKAVDYRLHVFASLRGGAGGYRLVSIETVPYPYRPLTELRVAGDLESTDTVEYVIPQDHSALLSIGGTLPEARVVGLVLRIETEVNASDPAWVGLIDPEHVQVNSGRLIGAGAVDLVVPYAAYDNEALRPRGVLNEVSAPVTVIVAPPQYIDSVSPAGLLRSISTVTVP